MSTVWAFLLTWFGIGPLWMLPGILLEWPPPVGEIVATWAIVGLLTALLIWALDAIAEHTP